MNRRSLTVLVAALAILGAFAVAVLVYQRGERQQAAERATTHADSLTRPHSPVMGSATAPVTIVEFFDPACESCRAFYPYVKEILAAHPRDAKLVIRYVPFHGPASVEGVRILEAARAQNKLLPVLEALMETQPVWAGHDAPAPQKAWDAAEAAGLNLEQARAHVATGAADKLLEQEVVDVKAVGIRATPTFFVNGKLLTGLSPSVLKEAVATEAQRQRK
ncbi:MAG: thioredoxin domain-containing protein [Rubrivivax sp.]